MIPVMQFSRGKETYDREFLLSHQLNAGWLCTNDPAKRMIQLGEAFIRIILSFRCPSMLRIVYFLLTRSTHLDVILQCIRLRAESCTRRPHQGHCPLNVPFLTVKQQDDSCHFSIRSKMSPSRIGKSISAATFTMSITSSYAENCMTAAL